MRIRRTTGWLIGLLVATVMVCIFSVKLNDATHSWILFERCEEPITFGALTRIALGLDRPSYSACINNLRQIDGAKQEWALENKGTNGQAVRWKDIAPFMGTRKRVWCPHGGVYRFGKIGDAPTCSITRHKLD